ncbi:unnamed protein product [Adineta steineri]|uniref:Uncharacterized protein n=1 Tax=Adineta steineri TaxID=433720 RepID=A0A815KXX7_9BILA|nr:unnamed protein product [Adineta steineri]CAF1402542.1 unnamed protein product [Adineta steineri]CAF1431182.1 unnamed protein product [Adineta steineri]
MLTTAAKRHPHLQILVENKDARKEFMLIIREQQYGVQMFEKQRQARPNPKLSPPETKQQWTVAFAMIKKIFSGIF